MTQGQRLPARYNGKKERSIQEMPAPIDRSQKEKIAALSQLHNNSEVARKAGVNRETVAKIKREYEASNDERFLQSVDAIKKTLTEGLARQALKLSQRIDEGLSSEALEVKTTGHIRDLAVAQGITHQRWHDLADPKEPLTNSINLFLASGAPAPHTTIEVHPSEARGLAASLEERARGDAQRGISEGGRKKSESPPG